VTGYMRLDGGYVAKLREEYDKAVGITALTA